MSTSYAVEAELRTTSGPVTVQDVISYALPFHATCGGRGWTGTKEAPELCQCAVKRFLKRNAGRVVKVAEGEYAWLRAA